MSLKDKMEQELGVPVRLRAGAPGSLDVLVDGQSVYSKKRAAYPPDAAQIVHLIREKKPAP